LNPALESEKLAAFKNLLVAALLLNGGVEYVLEE
jgi:hypothetical protein